MEYDKIITHDIDMFMGKPKSGKTLIAGSAAELYGPMLYVAVGNDGGGRVLVTKYRNEINNGFIKVKNLKNDLPVNGKINKTSIEKLAELLRDLRKPDADQFGVIAIDTVGALQDDYKNYIIHTKGGGKLNFDDWSDIANKMLNIKDNMKRFSEEKGVKFIWIFHTTEQELYETSGLDKEIRIIPDVTIKTGVKYMKDASNIFYCCRKTVIKNKDERDVKFLTYVGPHPLMDTGTRDMLLETGDFVENFTYQKWQQLVNAGKLDVVNIVVPKQDGENKLNGEEPKGE